MKADPTTTAVTPRRRLGARALPAAVAIAAILLALPAGAAAQAGDTNRPNIVVVQTDDQRTDDVRVMRQLRRLVGNRGVTFRNHFATHPRCCPSRASLLTGQYSHNHGVQSNSGPKGGFDRLDHSRTLPVWLQRAGYHTGHIGKYMNGYNSRSEPPGWSEFYGTLPATTRLYGYRVNENGRVVEYGGRRSDYQTDVFADRAVSFIRRNSNDPQPFFLTVNPSAPHSESGKFERVGPNLPRNPRPAQRDFRRFDDRGLPKPPNFDERDISDKPGFVRQRRISDRRERFIRNRHISRLESLLAVDDLVGRIVRTLGRTGELRRTLIVFTSDNGYFRGEHRIPSGKSLLYEPSVRVPMMVRGPGFSGGGTRSVLTGNIDIAPTILDVANVQPQGRVLDGVSLAGGAPGGRDILLENGVGGSVAIRTPRFVYMRHDQGHPELYDLRRDPHQLESRHNAGSYRAEERQLARQLRGLRNCSGASCR